MIAAQAHAGQATVMWGASNQTAQGTATGPNSSNMHYSDGIVAGQVNAARHGILYQGSTIYITSIGSQSVVSNSIYGNGNKLVVNASQSSQNSGSVKNSGSISVSTSALKSSASAGATATATSN